MSFLDHCQKSHPSDSPSSFAWTPSTPSTSAHPVDADGDTVMCDSINYDSDPDTPMTDAPPANVPPPAQSPTPAAATTPPKAPSKPRPKSKLRLVHNATVTADGSPIPQSPTRVASSPSSPSALAARAALPAIPESPTRPVRGMERYYRG